MSFDIGRLDKLIDIQSLLTPADSEGGFDENYTTIHSNVWCQVTFKTGTEKLEQDKDTATTFVEFKIRHISGLTENMQIVYNSNNYDITRISEFGRDDVLVLTAKKIF